mmetsp:Transcript_12043/g.33337  ORF Transcript_12043/g.33337 Transcript_12043/m.33337 type:complete len:218 (+) Transcript_12043:498-1151(+)
MRTTGTTRGLFKTARSPGKESARRAASRRHQRYPTTTTWTSTASSSQYWLWSLSYTRSGSGPSVSKKTMRVLLLVTTLLCASALRYDAAQLQAWWNASAAGPRIFCSSSPGGTSAGGSVRSPGATAAAGTAAWWAFRRTRRAANACRSTAWRRSLQTRGGAANFKARGSPRRSRLTPYRRKMAPGSSPRLWDNTSQEISPPAAVRARSAIAAPSLIT